jgi:hypothetical protein
VSALLIRLQKEPAVIIGILAAAVLAAVQSLSGNGILSGDVADMIGKAIDPAQGGWALPILSGLVTRFFVFAPPSVQKIANDATFQKAGTVVDIGKPPEGPPDPPADGAVG